ncbi:MAG: hypothetical protein H7263_00385 [Candidatus Sericytochromatia bacterium]|nr:hypothetical protein [Candidatus Sericytochromatia bacterium]
MNAIDEIIEQSIKIAQFNFDILDKIKDKSQYLMLDDLFDITKIFVSRKGTNIALGFTIDDFKKQDPEGYFNKIVKGFCQSLVDISQSPLSDTEKEQIKNILNNRIGFEENKG